MRFEGSGCETWWREIFRVAGGLLSKGTANGASVPQRKALPVQHCRKSVMIVIAFALLLASHELPARSAGYDSGGGSLTRYTNGERFGLYSKHDRDSPSREVVAGGDTNTKSLCFKRASLLEPRSCLVTRVVERNGVKAIVPPPKHFVYSQTFGIRGRRSLLLRTRLDGTVIVSSWKSDNRQTPSPSNDDFSSAIEIFAFPFSDSQSNLGGSLEKGEPQPSCFRLSNTFWYKYKARESLPITALSTGDFVPGLAVHSGTSLRSLSERACGRGAVNFETEANKTYFVQVGSVDGDSGNLSLALSCAAAACPPPSLDNRERPCITCPPPCEDDRFALLSHRWQGKVAWSFRRSSTPPGVDKQYATRAVRSAAETIRDAMNSCGLEDRVDFRIAFRGITSRQSSFGPSGLCGETPDRRNQADFGPLDSPGTFGGACILGVWVTPDELFPTEGDIRLNEDASWSMWCDQPGEMDIQGIATHEWGHIAGLNHSPGDSRNLTMTGSGPLDCGLNLRTLGLGDVRGLRKLY